MQRDAHFQSLLLHIAQSTEKKKETQSSDSTISHLFLRVPDKGAPCHVPPSGPLWRDSPSPEPMVHLFIHIESPVKELSHEMGVKHMVTHVGRRPTYNGVHFGSMWGSL
jgi:hypothetical protein